MNKLCQGCRYSKIEDTVCLIAREQSEKKCPCTTCLVKAMCIENCDIRIKKRIEIEKEIRREQELSRM
jgi:hypothetical protein